MTEVLQRLSLKHELRGSVLQLFNTLNQLNIDLTRNAYSEQDMAKLIRSVNDVTSNLETSMSEFVKKTND